MRFLKNPFSSLLVLALLFTQACDSGHGHDHINAEGLVLIYQNQEIFRYEAPNDPGVAIEVMEGATLGPVEIKFINRDGELFSTENPEFNLRWTIKDTGVGNIQHVEGEQWKINLIGVAAGQTEVMFEVYHIDHADFETIWFEWVTTAEAVE